MKIFIATILFCSCLEAHALGSLADVRVVDRGNGAALPAYYHRGEYWVAGSPGARYAIEVRNRSGERVLAVTAVDGVNTISGETAAWDQTGYVFTPGESYQITGWRKSDAEVAAFSFTALPNSYAARTARPENVGVIGVALFRERRAAPPEIYRSDERAARDGPSSTPAAPSTFAEARSKAQSAERDAPRFGAQLGTGHGERESSHVSHTEFERLQPEPNEVVKIRYDSYENLVAMGIVPRRPPVSRVPNPFPASADARYVPDPPG